ncbi:U-box-domain-containing protein [Nadsonia fulvescens var. elongata DSM 6958]|uniref:RING-type E3 ubiquitin transferase n=1 Tax=Nadsonia fulvescens var. elongata DSM 6958 TaxID=857566 RepID=A0A1E3PP00_9ASCO|nr:U-box-domain-containing protein [Nadsonia fulvescens var. elongata DSM 6958]
MTTKEKLRQANDYKYAGNISFHTKNYTQAMEQYSKAIICDPTNPVYFTNRALCHYLCKELELTEVDCTRAIELLRDCGFDADTNPQTTSEVPAAQKPLMSSLLKAQFYLGMSLFGQERWRAAIKHLKAAYPLCRHFNDPKLMVIIDSVRICERQLSQEVYERETHERAQLHTLLMGLLNKKFRASCELKRELHCSEEYDSLKAKYESNVASLTDIFSQVNEKKKKEHFGDPNALEDAPDYLIDPISLDIFRDPVITRTGQTYERAWLLEHLATSKTDPMTRGPLYASDLVPNIAIRNAAEAFLKKNMNPAP